ncbi:ABC transporter substrate-binding protein [Candidatus Chloroploca asiatica]|uniref:ABC transporter substrate-binding protein n=1 Tax=Candidatus Chloroploca asiatica TaxID=1506545 RepID=A0A2H3KQG1_9CHLR|nr:ABC transporter substrate-binding protein [Candidatus Chloroploca asiatica]PDV99721.1 ABC transporter substrate-binding protein [Candidatus Chloroploca asiatica]
MLRKFSLFVLIALFTAMIAACGGGQAVTPTVPPAEPAPTEEVAQPAPTEEVAAPAPTEEVAEPAPTEAPAPSGSATAALADRAAEISEELVAAFAGEYSGTSVTMTGPFTDQDAVNFNNAIREFEELTGIDIQYEGSKEFETSISIRVDGGNPPDIADFPQPGLLANFVRDGKVIDVGQFVSADWLSQNYNQSWLDMATMESPSGPITAGIWQRVNGKSLVWYPRAQFEAADYTIPTTWDELLALTDEIAADGDPAWCVGIESGTATGWPATDWMEEIMLRTTSLENYDRWVTGDLTFSSPEVKAAAEKMAEIWFNDEYVYGGRAAIVTTGFGDSPLPMFQTPPGCWLHKQGNFITSFFPSTAEAGVDFDFFYLPSIDPAYGDPVLVAGDLMAMFNDRPEVRAVMSYFSSGASLQNWLQSGGAISPHNDSDLSWYANDIERGVGEIILNATSLRFDASDLMPGQVGAGSFWTGMTDFVAGTVDLDTAMREIDAAWPR